jgi:hypothetical protein
MRLLLIAAGCLLLVRPLWSAEEFQAGAAQVDITPPVGHAMWGYGGRHDAPSVGVLDPLRARALVLAAGSHRIALVGLDLGRAPTRQSTAAIRAKVKEAGVDQLFLVGSHSHHGPVIETDQWPTPQTSYVRQLEQKLAMVILEANKAARPARLGIASRTVPFNRNRHSKRADPPIDRELLVVRIEDQAGKVIAHAVNFAAHPTMQSSKDLRFSADYPGALGAWVEKETGAPCLFLQGAAGDLSTNPGALRGPDEFGQALGKQVLEIGAAIRCEVPAKPTLQLRDETLAFKCRIDLANPLVKNLIVRAFYRDLVDFYEGEYRDGVRPQLTVALLNERIGIVGVSGEFFCGHALSLKRRARLDHLLFLGYCNDYQQYFPTIEAASEGGYGTDPPVAPAELGAGERIMDRALIHLYQMQGKLTR